MRPSLRLRLVAGHALVVVAALALMTVLAMRQQRAWVVARSAEALERQARQTAAGLPARADWESLATQTGRFCGCRVTLIDRSGRVLGDSDVPPDRLAAVENHAQRPEVRSALLGASGQALRHSRTVGEDLVYVAVPAAREGAIAVVRLAEPLVLLRRLDSSLVRISLVAALLALMVSIPLVFWVANRQASRIRALERVTRRLGAGDSAARAREHPADELGRLGGAINRMAAEGRQRLDLIERERDERERILAHLGDGVALLDEADHVIRMNRSCADLLGVPLPAPAGTPLAEVVRSAELESLARAARRENRTVEDDVRLWSSAGQRLLRATATPLGEGAALLVLHDLTEMERLVRMRQDFVANVSHELRTPLTSLRGYAETLLDGGLEDPEHRERFVRVIRDQAVRLEAIAEDLLSLADLERPGAKLERAEFDLADAAARQVAAFRPRAEACGLTLALERGPAVTVRADRRLVEQLLANLLDNAVKYTERGGVRVRVGGSDARAWCEVEDTGSGIPEADQPRVFERFYRVDKARSREKGGTGLGLSIVKHIATLHGGEVSLRSRPGSGSTFRFELPRSA